MIEYTPAYHALRGEVEHLAARADWPCVETSGYAGGLDAWGASSDAPDDIRRDSWLYKLERSDYDRLHAAKLALSRYLEIEPTPPPATRMPAQAEAEAPPPDEDDAEPAALEDEPEDDPEAPEPLIVEPESEPLPPAINERLALVQSMRGPAPAVESPFKRKPGRPPKVR